MAAKFPSASDVQLRPRKGHDMTWSCDDHGEPIKFYCREHKIPICHPCATKDHGQKPCKLDNIGDVILEMGTQLENKLLELEEMMQRMKRLDSEIQSCSDFVSNHLEAVIDEVYIAYEDKIKSVKDKEREDTLLINKEADKEIRIINEKMERRVTSCRLEAAKKQRIIQDTQSTLLSNNTEINMTVGKKIEDFKSKNQHIIDTMENISSKIKRIKQKDKSLVNEAPQVIASLDESVSENVHQDILDSLDHLKCEVQIVKFVEGKIYGDDYARIDGYIGKWELVKSIDMPPIINSPQAIGLISNDELLVSDSNNKDVCVSNITNGQTHRVITGNRNICIKSCAPVDSNLIVCGKWKGEGDCMTGDSLAGYITLYDRQWKVIRDITIPITYISDSLVCVDVDRDDMILAAEHGQPNIYVINPADGKIVHIVTMQGNKVWDRIQALSSGDIVVKTSRREFTVISRSGDERAVIRCDEWGRAWCCVDKLTDTLYITYRDSKRSIWAVDQVSCNGDIQAKRIVEYKDYVLAPDYCACPITASGNLTGCNGDIVLVYKKRFVV